MNAIILTLLFAVQQPAAPVDAVIQRATAYVAKYEAELGNLIGSEQYLQNFTSRRLGKKVSRQTSSDVLLIQVGTEWAALRKVNRVDGAKPKKVDEGFTGAFSDSPEDNAKRLLQMKLESKEYNLGDINRDINSPTFALKLLRESEVWRFSFERAGTEKIDGVSTWVIRFTERGTNTLVRGDRGELLHSTGTLWIEPATGRVLKTDFLVDNPWGTQLVKAKTTVTYAKGKTLDLLVPHEMLERYETPDSVTECLAQYSNFRPFEVSVKFDLGPTKPH